MEYNNIGLLIPSTLPLVIAEVFIVLIMVEVDLCHKITGTIFLAIVDFIIVVLMLEVELMSQETSHSSSHNCG